MLIIIMNETIPRLNANFQQFSLSKLALILQPHSKLPLPADKILEDIVLAIVEQNQIYIDHHLLKLKNQDINKQSFYKVIQKVINKKIRDDVKSIEVIIKRQRLKIELLLNDPENVDPSQEITKIALKTAGYLALTFIKIKVAIDNIELFILRAEKLFQWSCECGRQKCKNRYSIGVFLDDLYTKIFLSSDIILNEVVRMQDMKDEFQEMFELSPVFTHEQIDNLVTIKSAAKGQFNSNKHFLSIILVEPHDDHCVPQIQDEMKLEKTKRKRKKKIKNKKEEEQEFLPIKQVNNDNDKTTKQMQDDKATLEEDKRILQIQNYLSQLQIIDEDRVSCRIDELWLERIKPEHFFKKKQ